jgi:phosphate-selective porin OprO/OprP
MEVNLGFIERKEKTIMKKIIASVCCIAVALAISSEGWSATKKRRKHHKKAAATEPAPVPPSTPPVATPPPEPPKPEGWNEKLDDAWHKHALSFKSHDEKYSLNFRIALQTQFLYQTHSTEQRFSEVTFKIRRAKFFWFGNAFSKNLDYKFEINFAAGTLQDALEYAYVDYRFFNPLRVEVGQFKVPYNRQQINGSERQEFPERSLASDAFRFNAVDANTSTICTLPGGGTVTGSGITCGAGATQVTLPSNSLRAFQFDPGIMIHGDAAGKKFEYYAAVTNGSGNTRLNVNKAPLVTGRLVGNILGQYGYSESDVEYSEHPALTIGASGGFDDQDLTHTKFIQAGAETGFKYKGFALQAEYYYRNDRIGTFTDAAGKTQPNIKGFLPGHSNDHGYYAQAGYFVIPHHFEIAARASQLFLAGPFNNKGEFSAGFNYYILGHDLKIQTDYSFLRNSVDPSKFNGSSIQDDHRIRVQLQTWF